jgi:hypothetical protein
MTPLEEMLEWLLVVKIFAGQGGPAPRRRQRPDPRHFEADKVGRPRSLLFDLSQTDHARRGGAVCKVEVVRIDAGAVVPLSNLTS